MGRAMKTGTKPYPPILRLAAAVLAGVLMVIIAYYSLIPAGDVPDLTMWDKVRHFSAYAALAVAVATWLWPHRIAAWAAVTAVGALMEVAQALAGTGREASIADAFANGLGAAVGCGLVWILALMRRA